jgi:hypothetical protein
MKTINVYVKTRLSCWANIINLLIRKQKWKENPSLNSMKTLILSTSPAQPCLKQ